MITPTRRFRSPRVKTEHVFATSGDRSADNPDPPTPTQVRPSRRRKLLACCILAGSGLVLVVVGSFLPWVISGTVSRSSYAIVGIVDRLGVAPDGTVAFLVELWPWFGALSVAPVIAGILRWWRVSGILCVLFGIVAAALSLGVLILAGGRGGTVRLAPIGPAVMAAGAILLVCGGLALALGAASPIRHIDPRLTATQPA